MQKIFIKHKLLFICCITAFLSGCNDRQIELKIIPSNQVEISWDSNIYQHTGMGMSRTDSTAADSLARVLNESSLAIEEMWYPNDENRCDFPMREGTQIIIKLAAPDTSIYKYGFQKNSGGFPVNCFPHWRQYKFISQ